MPKLMEVLEYFDDTGEVMVARVPEGDECEIKWGAQLTVRESQNAIFFRDGKAQMVFKPGRYVLQTQNLPVLTKFVTRFGYGPDSPFRSEVYFVNMKLFSGLKWGTPQAIAFRDTDLQMVRLRAFGIYSMRIVKPSLFLNRMIGTQRIATTEGIQDYLRGLINAKLIDVFGDIVKSVFDLPKYYSELGVAMKARLAEEFGAAGLEMVDFAVEAITPPEEVQKMIDERTKMAALGNMDTYMKYKAAQALHTAAGNQSGMVGGGMGLGAGLGMGMMMPGMMQQAFMNSPQQGPGGAPPQGPGAQMAGGQVPPAAPGGAAMAAPAAAPAAAAGGGAQAAQAAGATQAAAQQAAADPYAVLKKLKELLDLGAISQEEFDSKKTQLLGQI